MTITPKHAFSLAKAAGDLRDAVKSATIISASEENFPVKEGIYNFNWQNILGA